MTIAATKPTIPASPKACTSPIMLSAIPPTNGTLPPSNETTIPKPSSDITTEVKEFTVEFNPDNIFIATSLFVYSKQNELIRFVFNTLSFSESNILY